MYTLESETVSVDGDIAILEEQVSNLNINVSVEEETVEQVEEETEDVEETEEVEEEETEEEQVEETEDVEQVVEEEEEEEQVEETEEEEQVVEEEEEQVEEEVEEVEEEEGVYEITIKGKRYYTTNETSGLIFSVLDDDDVGDEIGKFVNGKPVWNK